MAKQRVLLIGATGHTGKSILDGLLEYGKYDVEAIIRPSSAEKPEVRNIAGRGVKIVVADINDTVDNLVPLLKGVDVGISALDNEAKQAEKNIATAAKKAGVKRFVPCSWATVAPAGGVMKLRDLKEDVFNHVKKLYLPYTVIDVGLWHQVSSPRVPSGRFDYALIFPNDEIHGDGNTPTIIGDLRDIGRWTARIIDDERTLNKFVYTCSDVLSENQIITTVEEFTGEKIQTKKVPVKEIEARIEEAKTNNEKDPHNFAYVMMRYRLEYAYSQFLRGDSQPGYAKYLGYLDARELYPDFKPITFREFLEDLQDGKIEKPRYNIGPATKA